MLDKGQRLCIAGTQEVTSKVLSTQSTALEQRPPRTSLSAIGQRLLQGGSAVAHPTHASSSLITSRHVLQWVMGNTVEMMLQGVMEHAKKGLHFVECKAAAAKGQPLVQQDVYELDAMYGEARVAREVGEEVRLLVQQQQQRSWVQEQQGATAAGAEGAPAAPPAAAPPAAELGGAESLEIQLQQLSQNIQDRSVRHGQGHMVISSKHGCDEECERELQKEEEEEELQERQARPATPVPRFLFWKSACSEVTSSVCPC